MEIKKDNRGQILIIFLGIMGVALGVGLAMSRRVISNIQQGNRAVVSSQAYYAAESGVESALVRDDLVASCTLESPCTGSLNNGCAYSYYADATANLIVSLAKDKVLSLRTTGSSGNIRFYWNKSVPECYDPEGDDSNALEVIKVLSGVYPVVQKSVYSCCLSDTPAGFLESSGSGDGDFAEYDCSTPEISLSSIDKVLVKMLYVGGVGPGSMAYDAPGLVTEQGVIIYSQGSCSGDITRTLKVTKPNQGSGQDFSFGLFVPNNGL